MNARWDRSSPDWGAVSSPHIALMPSKPLNDADGGLLEEAPAMPQTYRYRGYEIVPTRQWASWCANIYATRPDLPLLTRSTLRTLATRKEDAVSEAQASIDKLLARWKDRPRN